MTPKILFASAEVAPFSKTGGLGDVAGALPTALKPYVDDMVVISPLYADVKTADFSISKTSITGAVQLGQVSYSYVIHQTREQPDGVRTLFVANSVLYDRPGIYTTPDGEGFSDNNERFFFYQLVILDLLKRGVLEADIVHCNDHHTGLLPVLLKHAGLGIKTVFTIHNFLYHGHFSAQDALLLPAGVVSLLHKTQWDNYSALLEGIDHADRVNTVSPGYARELIRGEDLDINSFAHILAASNKFSGIVNGIDTRVWDPAGDALLPYNYSAKEPAAKLANKQDLLIRSGLDSDVEAPLFGSISRLVENKGFPLIVKIIDEFVNQGARFVFLGSGDPRIAYQLEELVRKHPGRVSFFQGYSETLAHLIEAGSDCFLMPSRFEPCGLNQLYSLRYGTIPIVNSTGGLADTVTEVADDLGTGFVMNAYSVPELRLAMLRALSLYQDKKAWQATMKRGMTQDWSWDRSAMDYQKLYQEMESE